MERSGERSGSQHDTAGVTRRGFLKAAGAAGLAVAAAPWFNVNRAAAASASASEAPILVVIIDDWMNYRAMDRYIPNWPRRSAFDPWTRSFARKNLWFMNAHTASTACGSSRPAMLWGIPPHESGIYNNRDAEKWMSSAAYVGRRSIVGQLKDAGWRTHGFGKVFHSNYVEKHDPGCWTEFTPHIWRDDRQEAAGGVYSAYDSPSFRSFGHLNGGLELMPDHEMVTEAVRFVERMGPGDAAFVGIKKPHVPLRVPQRFFDAIDPSEIVLPAWGNAEVADEAHDFLRGAHLRDMKAIRRSGEWRHLIHSYLAAVKFADFEFGRLLRSTPAGTRVILTSDHGFALGERRALSKNTLWDQSTAVPLVVGGVGQRRRIRTATSLLDISSTIQDFAGLPVQNESLVSIANRPTDRRRAVVTSYRTVPWAGSRLASSVRRGGHQLIVYEGGHEELYYVHDDPLELVNLADRPWKQNVKAALMESIPTSYA